MPRLYVLLLLLPLLIHGDPILLSHEVMDACTQGNLESLKNEPPATLVHGRSAQGETCLHVAGIYGRTKITSYLLQQDGVDPDVRSSFAGGLRMTPLAWNVYGGHVENVHLLLEGGANVNLDFDDSEGNQITLLDVVDHILDVEDASHLAHYRAIRNVLLAHGAKHMNELSREL